MQFLNKLFYLPVLLFAVIFFACKGKSKTSKAAKPNPPVMVDVLLAKPQPVNNSIEANGTVVANEYVELRPEVSGRLIYLKVAEGSHVTQGTVIAKINDADLRAQLNKTKVQLELAETTVSRYKQLLDAGGLNQSDYDLAVNQVNGYKADIQYTSSLIDKTVIRAPFNGIVGLRQVSPGAYVSPTTVIATLQQVNQLKIDFTLPEAYGNLVKNGMEVEVALDMNNAKREKATIIATEPGANTDTRNIKVRAVLQQAAVNPGAFAKVYISEAGNRTAILVPTNAIIPDDKNNQLVLVKNGKAAFVNVQTGNRQANNVEIVSGLNDGDSIVVTGVLFARPNANLKIRSVKKADDLLSADTTQKQ